MFYRLLGVVLVVTLAFGLAQSQKDKAAGAAKSMASASAAEVEQELKQIEQDWANAAKNHDADKIGEILASSWSGISWEGKMETRAKALADAKDTKNTLDSMELGPMKVRVFGNTAIVTGSDTEKSTMNGKDTSGQYMWMDVFVKQGGKWKAVASEATRVGK